MATTNEKIADRIVARALRLQRLGASERRKVLAMMEKMESQLTRLIIRIDPTGVAAPTYRVSRQEKLIAQAREYIRANYREMRDAQKSFAYQLAKDEAVWFTRTAAAEVGVNILTNELPARTLRVIASDTLIQGSPAAEWWSRQAGGLERRFSDTVRQGILRGETTPEIVQRVAGTKAAGYADGIMETTRRQAEGLVRTSVQTVANEARDKLYEENSDIVKGVTWVATLDPRSCETCMALDGKSWSLPDYEPIGHEIIFPGPVAHFACRCTQVGVFKSFAELSKPGAIRTEAGGNSTLQKQFEERLRERGLSEDKIKTAVFEGRASMDGEVPSSLTFSDWLKDKSESFQNEMLGPGRAELFREGKITLTDLVNQNGRPLTLDQLRNR